MYTTELRLKDQSALAIDGPTVIVLHSLANSWNFEGGIGWLLDPNNPLEAHYAIRWDGYRVNIVSYYLRADANYNANRFAISVETDSDLEALEPWTDDQCASIIELCVFLIQKFPTIQAILVPDPYGDPGIGWHVMWGAPGYWTPVAKTCPGPARIQQVTDVIIPGVQAALAGSPVVEPLPDTPGEEEITVAQIDDLKKLIAEGFASVNTNIDGEAKQLAATVVATGKLNKDRVVNDQRSNYRVMLRTLAAIQTAIARNADPAEVRTIVDDAVKEIESAIDDLDKDPSRVR